MSLRGISNNPTHIWFPYENLTMLTYRILFYIANRTKGLHLNCPIHSIDDSKMVSIQQKATHKKFEDAVQPTHSGLSIQSGRLVGASSEGAPGNYPQESRDQRVRVPSSRTDATPGRGNSSRP